MIPTARRFDVPGDAAKKLFENSNSLQITMHRGGSVCGPFIIYELLGGFTPEDGDLQEIANDLLQQFSELPSVGGCDDDSDD